MRDVKELPHVHACTSFINASQTKSSAGAGHWRVNGSSVWLGKLLSIKQFHLVATGQLSIDVEMMLN